VNVILITDLYSRWSHFENCKAPATARHMTPTTHRHVPRHSIIMVTYGSHMKISYWHRCETW